MTVDELAAAVGVRPGWRDLAECRGQDPNLFHPEKTDAAGRAAALEFCARCPVMEECRAEVLGRDENPVGIIGGLSEKQRRVLRRELVWSLPAVCSGAGCDAEVPRGPSGRPHRFCGPCEATHRAERQRRTREIRRLEGAA